MNIKLAPSKHSKSKTKTFTATVEHASEIIAEIKDAPRDIATRWAAVMHELHEEKTVIEHVGMCIYCGSTKLVGEFCGDCQRVHRSK